MQVAGQVTGQAIRQNGSRDDERRRYLPEWVAKPDFAPITMTRRRFRARHSAVWYLPSGLAVWILWV